MGQGYGRPVATWAIAAGELDMASGPAQKAASLPGSLLHCLGIALTLVGLFDSILPVECWDVLCW